MSLRQEQAHILEIGMVATHVHILVRISPTTRLPRLMQRLKGGSAVIANRERRSTTGTELQWSKGYFIQSVSPRAAALAAHNGRAAGGPGGLAPRPHFTSPGSS